MARRNRPDAQQDTSAFVMGYRAPGAQDGPAPSAGAAAPATVPGRQQAAPGRQRAADFPATSLEGTVFAGGAAPDLGPDYGRRRRGPAGVGTDEVSMYNQQQRERFAMDPRQRTVLLLLAAAVLLIPVTLVLPTQVFQRDLDLALALGSVAGRIGSLGQLASGTAAGNAMLIYVLQVLAVAVAGAALALNGAVYQGALKNALAAPSTLGVMSGASLGSVFYTLVVALPEQESSEAFVRASELAGQLDAMDPLQYFVYTQGRVLCCLAGCAVVVALVLAIAFAAGRGRVSKVGLLVSGQVFTAIIASVIDMVHFYIRDHGSEAQVYALRNIMGGTFDNITQYYQVLYLAVPVALGVGIVMALRNRLNLLAFGDDEARAMGISVNFTRNLVIIVCTVLTAVVVSYVGSVGFVGFLVPHLARKLVGPDFRYLIPASVCLGAAYLLVAYWLMNFTGLLQGSVGTFTSIIGIVFFAVLAIRQRARGNVDWI